MEKCWSNYLAEYEQLPLPVTALIASVFSDIKSDKHRHSRHTNEMMKYVGAPQCLNGTKCTKITRVNPNKLLPLIDPGKKMEISLSNEIEGGE